MLYDSPFKEVLNPETTPERLSWLLSLLLKRKATVKAVLPNDNSRLGDELSLVIADMGTTIANKDATIASLQAELEKLKNKK